MPASGAASPWAPPPRATPLSLPRLLSRFQAAHPAVTLSVRASPESSVGLVDAVATGRLDVAFVSVPGAPPTGVMLHPLARVPLQLVLPPGHRLAAPHRGASLDELAAERWVDLPVGFDNRAVVDEAFARARLHRSVTLEVVDAAAVPAFVEAGLGVALVPAWVPLDGVGVHHQHLRGEPLTWPVALAQARPAAPRAVVMALLATVRSELREAHAHRPADPLGPAGT